MSTTTALTTPKVSVKSGTVIEPMTLTKSIKTKGVEEAVKRGWAGKAAARKALSKTKA